MGQLKSMSSKYERTDIAAFASHHQKKSQALLIDVLNGKLNFFRHDDIIRCFLVSYKMGSSSLHFIGA